MTIHVGLIGLGTVGQGLLTLLDRNKDYIQNKLGEAIQVDQILVRNLEKKRDNLPKNVLLTDSFNDFTKNSNLDIIIEVAGGIHPAKEWLQWALENGRSVVTANKELIASHGSELIALAKQEKVGLAYEAAVAGGIPIITNLTDYYATDQIHSLAGIVNGTTNYMLSQMSQKGWDYEQALTKAQELGFAEADPKNDVEGIDAAYKAIILARLVFGLDLSLADFPIEGITAVHPTDLATAKQLNGKIKLIFAINQTKNGVSVSVRPHFLHQDNLLASVENENNAILINSQSLNNSMLFGPGAGALPTAQAVLADLLTTAERRFYPALPRQGEWKFQHETAQSHLFLLTTEQGEALFNQLPINQALIDHTVWVPEQKQLAIFTKAISQHDFEAVRDQFRSTNTGVKEYPIYK
ncbi:homoserine dehydrogenase [Fructobacillus fructosus]|uniref:homoserine dehydrogenase n=1 Tax=Fructobacillus fructosus TaxID=1631 RepID=UPI0040332C1F